MCRLIVLLTVLLLALPARPTQGAQLVPPQELIGADQLVTPGEMWNQCVEVQAGELFFDTTLLRAPLLQQEYVRVGDHSGGGSGQGRDGRLAAEGVGE